MILDLVAHTSQDLKNVCEKERVDLPVVGTGTGWRPDSDKADLLVVMTISISKADRLFLLSFCSGEETKGSHEVSDLIIMFKLGDCS